MADPIKNPPEESQTIQHGDWVPARSPGCVADWAQREQTPEADAALDSAVLILSV